MRLTIDREVWQNRWSLLFCGGEKFGVPEIVDGAGDQAGDDDEGISENHGHGGRGL